MQISKSELIEIISVSLNCGAENLSQTSISSDIPEWDSMGQINIMLAFEERFPSFIEHNQKIVEADSVKKIIAIFIEAGFEVTDN